MDKSNYFKIAVIVFLVVFAILSFMVIKPFFIHLLSAVILAYIFQPLYSFLLKKIKNKTVTSLLMTFLILLIIIIPMIMFFNAIKDQTVESYVFIRDYLNKDLSEETCDFSEDVLCKIRGLIDSIRTNELFIKYVKLDEIAKTISNFVINMVTSFLINLPSKILNLFIMFFAIFFFFKDGDKMSKYIKNAIPMKIKHKKTILKRLDDVIFAVVYGNLAVAFIQGFVALVGYFIFGVKNPIIWGMLTVVGALIPFFGTATIWVPLSFFMFISGVIQNEISVVWKSLGLFVYGTLLISTVDNFIKPYIIGDKANVHPLVILLGVFGGLALVGPIGLVLGPVILALFMTSLTIYLEERYKD